MAPKSKLPKNKQPKHAYETLDSSPSNDESTKANEEFEEVEDLEPLAHELPVGKDDAAMEDNGSEEESAVKMEDEKLSGKKRKSTSILIGLRVDISWCKKVKWAEFLNILNKQKWFKLVDVHALKGVYEPQIQEFCQNFELVNGLVLSLVGGKIVRFDEIILGETFGIPTVGYKEYMKGRAKLQIEGYKNSEILTFFGGKATDTSLPQEILSPLHKILFQFVRRFLIPRSQKKTTVNLMDLSLMFCLAKHIPINFPSIMISHLSHCIKNKLVVGYGNLLTTVFQSCKLELPSLPTFKLQNSDILNDKMLGRYKLEVRGGVVVKIEEEMGDVTGQKRKIEEGVGPSGRTRQKIGGGFSGGSTTVHLDDDVPPSGNPASHSTPTGDFTVPDTVVFQSLGSVHGRLNKICTTLDTMMTQLNVMATKVAGLEEQLTMVKHEVFSNLKLQRTYIEDKIDKVASHFVRSS